MQSYQAFLTLPSVHLKSFKMQWSCNIYACMVDVHNVMLWIDRSAYGITASCCHILFLCNDRCSSATLAFVMYDLCVGHFCKYLFFDIHCPDSFLLCCKIGYTPVNHKGWSGEDSEKKRNKTKITGNGEKMATSCHTSVSVSSSHFSLSSLPGLVLFWYLFWCVFSLCWFFLSSFLSHVHPLSFSFTSSAHTHMHTSFRSNTHTHTLSSDGLHSADPLG